MRVVVHGESMCLKVSQVREMTIAVKLALVITYVVVYVFCVSGPLCMFKTFNGASNSRIICHPSTF